MISPGKLLVLLLLLSTSLSAQENKNTRSSSASVTIVNFNDMNKEELLFAKAQLKEEVKYCRLVDQKLSVLGYHYPANTKVTVDGNRRKFTFTDIITSDDPMAIKAFIDNLKNENLKDLVDIKINPADHQCELTVAQNIDPELLKHIFSKLGFDGYQIYAQN